MRIPFALLAVLILPSACTESPTSPGSTTLDDDLVALGEVSSQLAAGEISQDLDPAAHLFSVMPGGSTGLAFLGPEWIQITPQSGTAVSNCIPFGQNTFYGFTGFVYRDVPPFNLRPGMQFGFDLGSLNDVDTRRDIYFAVANKNPGVAVVNAGNVVSQGIMALGWTQVASETQTPETPRGNTVKGDYELRYTAEAAFDFPGGGLIVGFSGSPPATYADAGCDQVLVTATSNDASGYFYSRFFNKPHLHLGVLDDITAGATAGYLGGIVVERALPVPFDIRPGSCPNPVNVAATGVLPVAILGTDDFDASDIDHATVRLEGVGPLRSSISDVGTPYSADLAHSGSCNAYGADGIADMTFKFRTQDVVAGLGPVSDRDELVLEVTGELLDGTPIVGHDIAWILSK